MYGIIHKAIRSAVLLHTDEKVWLSILERAELTDEHFLSPAPYDDNITFQLIENVAGVMEITPADALRCVGEHWVDYAKGAGYGSIFGMAGRDLKTFLSNLDRMHKSLKVTLRDAVMPSFTLLRSDEVGFEILYRSQRSGLAPFVEGILTGVCRHYDESITITSEDQADGVHFSLVHTQNSGADEGRRLEMSETSYGSAPKIRVA